MKDDENCKCEESYNMTFAAEKYNEGFDDGLTKAIEITDIDKRLQQIEGAIRDAK